METPEAPLPEAPGSLLAFAVKVSAPLVANWLMAAPLAAVVQLRRRQVPSVELLPLASVFVNCAVWCLYGVLTADHLIMMTNTPGLVLGTFYLLSYFTYAEDRSRPNVRAMALVGLGYTLFVYASAMLLELEAAIATVGILGAGVSVVLMSSPLANIGRVLREQSTGSMDFGLTLAAFVNGSLWTVQGFFLRPDPAVWVPNLLGSLAGTVQLSLFALYGGKTEVAKPARKISHTGELPKNSWNHLVHRQKEKPLVDA